MRVSIASIRSRVGVVVVVEADQVEEAVGDEMAVMVGERLALVGRLARQRFEREHDVAEQPRLGDLSRRDSGEGEHVGRLRRGRASAR